MAVLQHRVRIEAPVEVIWATIADLVAVQRYNPMVATAAYLSVQHRGIGAVRRCELTPKGWVEERVWSGHRFIRSGSRSRQATGRLFS